MNKNLNSTLAEQASHNNVPKRVKAKEIFLGIDVHLRSNQVARKIDSRGAALDRFCPWTEKRNCREAGRNAWTAAAPCARGTT
jgi:hypothetical protein